MSEPFKPRLTIGPWHCPHYKSFHQKDPARCDDPFRFWLGLMPDGKTISCGVAADKRVPYWNIRKPLHEALAHYLKKLGRRLKVGATKAKKKVESLES